jgi:hypothetical protein
MYGCMMHRTAATYGWFLILMRSVALSEPAPVAFRHSPRRWRLDSRSLVP